MSYALGTIVGGVIAASGLIIARRPDAQEWIDKITPYQGWLGLGLFSWGLYWLVGFVLPNFGALTSVPVQLAVIMAVLVSGISIGFLLGFGLITKYALSKNAQAEAKGKAIRQRLTMIQAPLGLVAVASGVLSYIV
ncbi:MAG: hypothetical protein JKY56_21195 [Kofleriaceae bacterium]|nr:hypothetical protein [Kofleriaceae bacterium]